MNQEHTLIAVAYKRGGEFTKAEEEQIRNKAGRRSIQHQTYTFRGSDRFGYCLMLFDLYSNESASLLQRLRHLNRKFLATVASHIGIRSMLVTVIGY